MKIEYSRININKCNTSTNIPKVNSTKTISISDSIDCTKNNLDWNNDFAKQVKEIYEKLKILTIIESVEIKNETSKISLENLKTYLDEISKKILALSKNLEIK